MPELSHTRSISLFGLSDIKFYFDYDTDYFRDRQEVLSRLAFLGLPGGVQPAISPWWALAEVYRYELVGPSHNLTDLKTIQDWQLNREFKCVHGVIDVTAFGGTTRQYHEYVGKGFDLKTAILKNAEVRMRPVMMTTLSAAIGLLPASVATGIGAQSQQPLARVVVGGMLSSVT